MVIKKRGLGRGLDALLPKKNTNPAEESFEEGLRDIPVTNICPGKYQPRRVFREESLEELSASIVSQGLVQPIVLRKIEKGDYEIISGERRWRAAKLAGLETVPAVVKEASDESVLAMSLIENIQREDLNPLEEAYAMQRLIDEFNLTHEDVAKSLGKSRSGVSNTLRLINLDIEVAQMLSDGKIEMGHARALLGAESARQLSLANIVLKQSLNVRQTEELIRKDLNRGEDAESFPKKTDPDKERLETGLSQTLGQPVKITSSVSGKGKLEISFSSLNELDGLLARLGYQD